jgi:hypothetical protein
MQLSLRHEGHDPPSPAERSLLQFIAASCIGGHPRCGLRTASIGEFWGHPETRTFGELLIDLEEDRAARAVVFGLLEEMEQWQVPHSGIVVGSAGLAQMALQAKAARGQTP